MPNDSIRGRKDCSQYCRLTHVLLPPVSCREFFVPCLVLRQPVYGSLRARHGVPGTCKMSGDWMRRVSGSERLVTDNKTESARESWDKRCIALTPISRGEKLESVVLPTASARKNASIRAVSTCVSDIFGTTRNH